MLALNIFLIILYGFEAVMMSYAHYSNKTRKIKPNDKLSDLYR